MNFEETEKQTEEPARMSALRFSDAELSVLRQVYEEDKYPFIAVRKQLAERLKLSLKQITNWFVRRRHKANAVPRRHQRLTKQQVDQLKMNPHPNVRRIWEAGYKNLGFSYIQILRELSHIGKWKGPHSKFSQCTVSQLAILRKAFDSDPWPSAERIKDLAAQLGLKITTVNNWFGTRRYKQKMGVRRNVFNELHLETLSKFFKGNQNPSLKEIENLAAELHKTVKQVRCWFSWRRYELRRRSQSQHNSIRFNSVQLKILNQELQARLEMGNLNKMKIRRRNSELSKQLGLSSKQVKNWLNNHRRSGNRQFSVRDLAFEDGEGSQSAT